jgi:hypothetical protein
MAYLQYRLRKLMKEIPMMEGDNGGFKAFPMR